MKTEKVTKFFRNGKGNMSVRCVNHLAYHGICTSHVIEIPARRAKSAAAMER